MTYKRVTEEERRLINNWCQVGESLREMGRRLQRAASSISREIKRNKGGRGYRAKQAHEKAQARGRREGPRRFTPEVKEDVDLRLQEGWTPEIISQRARLRGGRRCARKRSINTFMRRQRSEGSLELPPTGQAKALAALSATGRKRAWKNPQSTYD